MPSVKQWETALRFANEVRAKKAELKRDLKSGKANIGQVLTDPPSYIRNMHLDELLLCIPKFGQEKTKRALRMAHLASDRKIKSLTDSQRAGLLWAIRRHQPRSKLPRPSQER